MSTLKTQENNASVEDFSASLEGRQKQQDCGILVELFARASRQTPRMGEVTTQQLFVEAGHELVTGNVKELAD